MFTKKSVFEDPSSRTSAAHPPIFSHKQTLEITQNVTKYRDIGTPLPEFLDRFIFSQSGPIRGEYNPMPAAVRYNLEADLDHNRKYVGTYFPRSFGESKEIFFQTRT